MPDTHGAGSLGTLLASAVADDEIPCEVCGTTLDTSGVETEGDAIVLVSEHDREEHGDER